MVTYSEVASTYLRTYLINWRRKESKKNTMTIMIISHDCPRSRLNALLFKKCFSNNQETNQKYKKYLWWYRLWYLLLSSLPLLCVSCVFGPVVWKTIWKQSCFWITLQQTVNTYWCNRNQTKVLLYFFWRNDRCCPMMIHRCIFHCVTMVLNHSFLLPMQRPGVIERIVLGSTTPVVRYIDVHT